MEYPEKFPKKILIICRGYPIPEMTGSDIRTMNFVRFFNKLGSVDIAYSYSADTAMSGNSIFSNKYLLKKKEYPQKIGGRISAILRGLAYPIREYTEYSEESILSIIAENDYDYILARYIDSAYCLFKLPIRLKRRVVVDFDDILSGCLYSSLFPDTGKLYKKIARNVNKKILIGYEKKCLNFGAALFCSKSDSMKIGGNVNQSVVPNIYVNRAFGSYCFGNGWEREKTLLFVGTLSYTPNVEGLRWFLKCIYPEFKKEHPDTKMFVVGFSPTDEVTNLCEMADGVDLCSNVPDLKEYYRRCRAVVVPLLRGGGTRIKILEAALANRPVLSTGVGAEGLDLIAGKHFLLFESSTEFLSRFRELLDDKKYQSLVRNAREFVVENYSTAKFEEAMQCVLQRIEQRVDLKGEAECPERFADKNRRSVENR